MVWFAVVLAMLLAAPPVWALNPLLDVSQYGHTAWSSRDGAFRGYPSSLAQTPDGYLWIGTELGLLRSDGARFLPWEPPAGSALPSSFIVTLQVTRDGRLWIGTSQGLAVWTGDRLHVFPEMAGQYITALAEDRDGLWVGTQTDAGKPARLCSIESFQVQCNTTNSLLGHFVTSLGVDQQGNLWVGASTGLWRWRPSPSRQYAVDDLFPEVHSTVEDRDGTLLVALNSGLRRVRPDGFEHYQLPGARMQLKPTALLRDRDGGLWIGTQDQGLLHVRNGRLDRFGRTEGLSGDAVRSLYEDREGNIWVATLNGLDRFRETAATTITRRQGLPSDSVMSVLASASGGVWIRTANGIGRWRDGAYTAVPSLANTPRDVGSSIFEDDSGGLWLSSPRGLLRVEDGKVHVVGPDVPALVYGIARVKNDMWISEETRGLLRIREGQIVSGHTWDLSRSGDAHALIADPSRSGLWLGFTSGGVSYTDGGSIGPSYTIANGLSAGKITDLMLERDGRLWASAEGGLSRIRDGLVHTLTRKNGLPCDGVHAVVEDDARTLWLRTNCGVIRIARTELDAWAADPVRTVAAAVYAEADGLPSHSRLSPFSPSATKDSDGRLWFATYDGAVVIDPSRIPFNRQPPPVHIERVTVDRVTYTPSPALRLPERARDIRIDYNALSLVVPEKVRFRYRLEGRDDDWVDAGDRRQAFYTDLPPKRYRFHVIAANNDGVWNTAGDAWEFSIAPAFYQTAWFRGAVVLTCAGLLWALSSVRFRRLAAETNLRFEERLAERTRIAQDLHDTLLQGSISASMQLHALAGQVGDQATRGKLDHVLQRFRQMIEEGRQTVQALRTSPSDADDLDRVLARDAADLAGSASVDVQVTVSGRRRPLHPLIRDDCYRIGREALANALRHAGATSISIDVGYYPDHLRMRIRDNGQGIDPAVLQTGRAGHWGLQGMRERATHIGGRLTLRSHSGGTEVDLEVPGALAFHVRRTAGSVPSSVTTPPAGALRRGWGRLTRARSRWPASRQAD